ncbi:MAG: PQQ-binding-like beta-propeller repeat protein [Planctomycetaceae bacterium]
MTVTAIMGLTAVIPLIPALPSLFALCGWLLMTLIPLLLTLRSRSRRHLILRFCWRQRIGLAVIGGLSLSLLLLLTGDPVPVSSSPGGPGPRTATDWPEYRGGLSRTGTLPGSPGPRHGGTFWTGGHGYTFYATPAVDGDRVYGSGFRGNSGRIFCWDQTTGDLLWSAAPSGYEASISAPVLAGNLLVIGEGLHQTTTGRVLALDLRPGHEGDTVWEFPTRSHVEATPTIHAGRVFAAAGDDGLYCLRLGRDVKPQDRVLWHTDGSRCPDAEAALPVIENQVVAGLGRDGNAICSLDIDTGRELARHETLYPVFSPAASDRQRIVFGTASGDYRNSGAGPGQVHCLTAATLEHLWSFDTHSSVLDAVAIHAGVVYAGTGDGRLLALQLADGVQIAEQSAGGPVVTAPAVTDQAVFVITEDGLVSCFTSDTLTTVWQVRLPGAGQCFSSVTIAGNRLFVGTSGGFFALGRPSHTRESP